MWAKRAPIVKLESRSRYFSLELFFFFWSTVDSDRGWNFFVICPTQYLIGLGNRTQSLYTMTIPTISLSFDTKLSKYLQKSLECRDVIWSHKNPPFFCMSNPWNPINSKWIIKKNEKKKKTIFIWALRMDCEQNYLVSTVPVQ